MGVGLKGLISEAERVARKRGRKRATTAHALLALYQNTVAGELLGSHGIAEFDLLKAVTTEVEEHDSVLGVAIERAERTATALSQGRASALHLLLSLIREPRSVAYHCLERLGVSLETMQAAVLSSLEAGPTQAEVRSPIGGRASSAPAEPGKRRAARPASRPSLPGGAQVQLALAEATESK